MRISDWCSDVCSSDLNVKKASGSRKRECDGEDQETAQNKNPGTEITGLRDRDGRQCKNARSNHAVHRDRPDTELANLAAQELVRSLRLHTRPLSSLQSSL